MRLLYQIFDKVLSSGYKMRFAYFPKAGFSAAIYKDPDEAEQFLYGEKTIEELEAAIMKDFAFLLNPTAVKSSMPPPPGFPRP